ncbi:hypothetical protein [Streptomyces botrytidirepellens]|nr:hypothetical protein [Streptomyces botrytidirepellens]
MNIFADPTPWLLAALCLQAFILVVFTADEATRPRQKDPRPVRAVLRGRAPAQTKGRVKTFARLYALSAVFLAAATASSALRHAPWIWTVLYAAMTVLTVLGAYAWNTAPGEPAAASTTTDPDSKGEDTPSNTPPS